MTLQESVVKLQNLLPKLKASDAKFASDLIASYKKYNGLTPKQEPWIGKLIVRAETPAFQVVASSPQPVNVGGFSGVVALFNKAKEHLKFPKITLLVNSTKVILSLNGPKSKAPGFVSISGEGKFPYRAYYGRVSPEGVFEPFNKATSEFLTALTALLVEFSKNPARVAKDHGKLTGHCCFCNKELGKGEDKRSILVGFGPVCANHYGLKAEWLSGVAKAEAQASVLKVSPEHQVYVDMDTVAQVEPTLTVSPEAQMTIDELAAELAASSALTKVDVKEAMGLIDDLYGKPCFFCEQVSANTKSLNGYVVCAECAKQLA